MAIVCVNFPDVVVAGQRGQLAPAIKVDPINAGICLTAQKA
jgi:hypothetical protein